MKQLRWGILGTARIAEKNWKAIHHAGNSVLTAVASRDVGRSRAFIEKCQQQQRLGAAPVALGSYEALLASRDVDAVYVPIPTGLRKEWVVRAAEAGKHVLCEKPCGASADDVRQMIEACRKHRVQFMDGVMFMHNPRLNRIREALNSGAIGDVKRITSHFSFFGSDEFVRTNIRAHSELEPLGCLGDLGWYCVRFALWVMDWRLPVQIHGRVLSEFTGTHSPRPVPCEFSGELRFDGDVSSGFYCSFNAAFRNWVEVTGTKGYLRVPDFVLPANGTEGALDVNGVLTDGPADDPASRQETNMVRNFASQVLSGTLNDAWPEMSLKTQQVVEGCVRSVVEMK